jgi:DnaK suppressor protein
MNYLNNEFIEKQKAILEEEKTQLVKKLKLTGEFPQYGDTEDDNAEEVEDFLTSKGQEKKLKIMLNDINRALKKISSGEYGYCENCGKKQKIDIERLKAFPSATTCIRCEKK